MTKTAVRIGSLCALALVLVGCSYLTRYGCTYEAAPAAGAVVSDADVEWAREIIQHRLRRLGVEHDLSVQQDQRIMISVSEHEDPDQMAQVVASVGALEFIPLPADSAVEVTARQPLPDGLADIEPVITGLDVASAALRPDTVSAEAIVEIRLDEDGARRFDEHAAAHLGDRFAIVVDDIVAAVPTISSPRFDGQARISGGFSRSEGAALAAVLDSGSLPYPITVSAPTACVAEARP